MLYSQVPFRSFAVLSGSDRPTQNPTVRCKGDVGVGSGRRIGCRSVCSRHPKVRGWGGVAHVGGVIVPETTAESACDRVS